MPGKWARPVRVALEAVFDPDARLEVSPSPAWQRAFQGRILPGLVVSALLGLMLGLTALGQFHWYLWTPAFQSLGRQAVLAGLLLAAFVLAARAPLQAGRLRVGRADVLLLVSLVAAFVAFGWAALALVAYLAAYRAVATSAGLPAWAKHGFLVLSHVGFWGAFSVELAPALAADDVLARTGLMVALFLPLRLVWLHAQLARRKFPDLSLRDVLLYFLLVPYSVVLPYMLSFLRLEEFQQGLADEDPDRGELAQRGARLLVYSVFFSLLYAAGQALEDRLRAGAPALSVANLAASLFHYPLLAVFKALGPAYLLVGMMHLLGFPAGLPFRSPLKSTSVLDWWRRYNVQFRDLLVDLFFYPVVLGGRKRPDLRLFLAVAAVFLVGSTFFHWAYKFFFTVNSFGHPQVSSVVENVMMCAAVGVLAVTERRRMERQRLLRRAAAAGRGTAAPVSARVDAAPARLWTWGGRIGTLVFMWAAVSALPTAAVNGVFGDFPPGRVASLFAFAEDPAEQERRPAAVNQALASVVSATDVEVAAGSLDGPGRGRALMRAVAALRLAPASPPDDAVAALVAAGVEPGDGRDPARLLELARKELARRGWPPP